MLSVIFDHPTPIRFVVGQRPFHRAIELAASFENHGDGSDGKKHNPQEFHDVQFKAIFALDM
jgi:hypothetical protein